MINPPSPDLQQLCNITILTINEKQIWYTVKTTTSEFKVRGLGQAPTQCGIFTSFVGFLFELVNIFYVVFFFIDCYSIWVSLIVESSAATYSCLHLSIFSCFSNFVMLHKCCRSRNGWILKNMFLINPITLFIFQAGNMCCQWLTYLFLLFDFLSA